MLRSDVMALLKEIVAGPGEWAWREWGEENMAEAQDVLDRTATDKQLLNYTVAHCWQMLDTMYGSGGAADRTGYEAMFVISSGTPGPTHIEAEMDKMYPHRKHAQEWWERWGKYSSNAQAEFCYAWKEAGGK